MCTGVTWWSCLNSNDSSVGQQRDLRLCPSKEFSDDPGACQPTGHTKLSKCLGISFLSTYFYCTYAELEEQGRNFLIPWWLVWSSFHQELFWRPPYPTHKLNCLYCHHWISISSVSLHSRRFWNPDCHFLSTISYWSFTFMWLIHLTLICLISIIFISLPISSARAALPWAFSSPNTNLTLKS